MVGSKSIDDQLSRIHFKGGWNSAETKELAAILLPEEEIFECVNGWYEGGYALLCATSIRVLLIDKKPFNFLTIEDLRFDTINQIDYNHRMFNASICINTGLKNLTFRSYNKPRLRDLISHVQHRMAVVKRTGQVDKEMHQRSPITMDEKVKAYLFDQFDQQQVLRKSSETHASQPPLISVPRQPVAQTLEFHDEVSSIDLYKAAIKEMFGKHGGYTNTNIEESTNYTPIRGSMGDVNSIDVNPLRVACGKLPLILRIRRLTISQNAIS